MGGVGADLFDDLSGGGGFAGLGGAWEVEAGDLEAVEEESGGAQVDGVGRDAAEDLADGLLDGGAVFGLGDVEAAPAVAGGDGGARGWATGGVVVVAELLAAEAGAAAAASIGEDVAALVTFWLGLHAGIPPPWGKS